MNGPYPLFIARPATTALHVAAGAPLDVDVVLYGDDNATPLDLTGLSVMAEVTGSGRRERIVNTTATVTDADGGAVTVALGAYTTAVSGSYRLRFTVLDGDGETVLYRYPAEGLPLMVGGLTDAEREGLMLRAVNAGLAAQDYARVAQAAVPAASRPRVALRADLLDTAAEESGGAVDVLEDGGTFDYYASWAAAQAALVWAAGMTYALAEGGGLAADEPSGGVWVRRWDGVTLPVWWAGAEPGAGDVTAEVQAAADALRAAGGETLQFGYATEAAPYEVANLVPHTGQTWRGVGRGLTWLRLLSNAAGASHNGGVVDALGYYPSNVITSVLDHLGAHYDGAAGYGGAGEYPPDGREQAREEVARTYASERVTIEDMSLDGDRDNNPLGDLGQNASAMGAGVCAFAVRGWTLRRLHIWRCRLDGVAVGYDETGGADACTFSEVTTYDCSRTGVAQMTGRGNTFTQIQCLTTGAYDVDEVHTVAAFDIEANLTGSVNCDHVLDGFVLHGELSIAARLAALQRGIVVRRGLVHGAVTLYPSTINDGLVVEDVEVVGPHESDFASAHHTAAVLMGGENWAASPEAYDGAGAEPVRFVRLRTRGHDWALQHRTNTVGVRQGGVGLVTFEACRFRTKYFCDVYFPRDILFDRCEGVLSGGDGTQEAVKLVYGQNAAVQGQGRVVLRDTAVTGSGVRRAWSLTAGGGFTGLGGDPERGGRYGLELTGRTRIDVESEMSAQITMNPAGDDNAITWTAVAGGTGGNSITVTYAMPADTDVTVPLTAAAVGNAITITLGVASDGSTVVTTALDVLEALEAGGAGWDDVAALVAGRLSLLADAGNDGSGLLAAYASTALVGGGVAYEAGSGYDDPDLSAPVYVGAGVEVVGDGEAAFSSYSRVEAGAVLRHRAFDGTAATRSDLRTSETAKQAVGFRFLGRAIGYRLLAYRPYRNDLGGYVEPGPVHLAYNFADTTADPVGLNKVHPHVHSEDATATGVVVQTVAVADDALVVLTDQIDGFVGTGYADTNALQATAKKSAGRGLTEDTGNGAGGVVTITEVT